MAYAPNEANAWNPDVAGDSGAWETLITNDAELYKNAPAVQVCAYGPYQTGTGGAAYRACYFALPGNYDQQRYSVTFVYSQTGSSATVALTITDGSNVDTGSAVLTVGGGSVTLTVTPSNSVASSTPRYGYIDMTAASGHSITITSIFVAVVPTGSIASGVLSSGFISVDSSWYAAEAPIPVEIVETLRNNPYKIAADRPQAIFSAVQPMTADARTGLWSTDAATFTDCTRIVLPFAPYKRTWRIWAYVDRYNTAEADLLVTLGQGSTILKNSHGVMQTTFTTDSTGLNFGSSVGNVVKLRVSSGSGSVALRTLQILEEPS